MLQETCRYEYVRFGVEEQSGIARLTLSRPKKLNSFNRQMAQEFLGALERCSHSAVRTLLVTGSDRAFSAGQDLEDVLDADGKPGVDLAGVVATQWVPMLRAIGALEKPVICAVNGVAAGAGANLALACDFVLAAETAVFVQSFAKIGLIPDCGGSFLLPRLVGLARAKAMVMLANEVSAVEAERIGLIYRAVPAPHLLPESEKLAARLASAPTTGLGLTKRLFNQSLHNDLERQLALEATLQGEAGRSHDYKEGVAAFLEKRKPTFTGR
ncbi:MAG: enoyl-CoA hydratase-related protein [Proteobacteria bacterium]|nr:enoyl-CoA hydratase-related protein [Pseudomonadota bacterium]